MFLNYHKICRIFMLKLCSWFIKNWAVFFCYAHLSIISVVLFLVFIDPDICGPVVNCRMLFLLFDDECFPFLLHFDIFGLPDSSYISTSLSDQSVFLVIFWSITSSRSDRVSAQCGIIGLIVVDPGLNFNSKIFISPDYVIQAFCSLTSVSTSP